MDLIFTDPVYQNIDDYRWLAETAARVLKPDSACLVFYGIGYLASTLDALQRGGLSYRWQGLWYQSNRIGAHCDIGFCVYSPFFWMEKGRSKIVKQTRDVINVPITIGNAGKVHQWHKETRVFKTYLETFTRNNEIIFDPFTGGGTVPAVCKMLGRRYLAFEIEPDVAELARNRVRQTQPPLPGLTLETQAALELD